MKSLMIPFLGFGLAAAFPTEDRGGSRLRNAMPVLGLTNITRSATADIKGRSLSGPFMGVDFPDPSIIWGDGSWKAYGTSSNGKHVPVATSSDTFSWSLTGSDALPDVGAWVDSGDRGIWAPDVQKNVSLSASGSVLLNHISE